MKKVFVMLLLTIGLASVSQAGNIDDLKKKCSGGGGDACSTLGALYSGLGKNSPVEKDMKKATEFWKRGCDLGSGSACTTYAMVLTNEDERLKTLKKACDLGNDNGCLSYNQTVLLNTLQNDCLKKNDLKSCAKFGGEIFLSGNYKTGKAILEDVCQMGSKSSCSDVEKIEALKDLRKLTLADQLSKECSDKKDKYACEKVGTFLIEINSFITSNVSTKEEKQVKAQEVMMNMMMAHIYIKEACSLGRKESCRTLQGLKAALEKTK